MVYNGILMETIGISEMVSIGRVFLFLVGASVNDEIFQEKLLKMKT